MQTKTNSMEDVIKPDTVLDSLHRVHDEICGLVASTDPKRLKDPTPCTEWDVRTLINHMAHVNLLYAAMADRTEPPKLADHLGNDFVDGYRKAARSSMRAYSREAMTEERYESPWGEISGAVLVQHTVNELMAHGWDLAKALGRPTNLLPDIATESNRIWREWFDDIGRQRGIGPEKQAPANAKPADEIAAFLGRDVNWRSA